MTVPTLALQVHATGASQVAALAQSVDALRTSLAALALQSNSGATAQLAQMANDFRNIRSNLGRTMAGLRTDIATDFSAIASQITKSSATVQKAAAAGAAQVKAAMGSIVGPSSVAGVAATNGQMNTLAQRITAAGSRAQASTTSFNGMAKAMNDGHSAARGLASGFGAMWLTWGNLLPLLTGAALSHGLVKTIRAGAEVQQSLSTIRVLSEETTESVGRLEQRLLNLARNGPYGPLEIADAMKTLSLAGLSAADVYASVGDVLNFAIAGDTGIKQAADTIVSIATAFNVTAENYGYITDVIAKAAAVSKTTVDNMGAAMKTASVVNQQYGASLTETAVALALLANAGITATMAGTSYRNMLADIAGRTPKVQKALDELGVKTIDPLTGKVREQAKVFDELMRSLLKYKPEDQFKFIQDIFSERGGKAGVALMNAMQKLSEEAKRTGQTVGSVYDDLREKIENSAGFAAKAAAEMSLTPMNQMKSVAATLQATMVEVFNSIQPYVISISYRLKEIFNSPEFKNGLEQMVKTFARFIEVVVQLSGHITGFALSVLALSGAATIVRSFGAAFTVMSGAVSAGVTTMGMATRAAGLLNPVLTGLIGVLQLAAGAWMLYQGWVDKSTTSTEEAGSGMAAFALLDRLEKERDRLDKVNQARREGISLMELEARSELAKLRGNDMGPLAEAKARLRSIDAQLASLPPGTGGRTRLPNGRVIGPMDMGSNPIGMGTEQERNAADKLLRLTTERMQAERDIAHWTDVQHETMVKTQEVVAEINALSRQAHVAGAAQGRPLQGTGTQGRVPGAGKPGAGGMGGGSPFSFLSQDNDRQTIEAIARIRESTMRDAFQREQKLLEANHKAGVISEGAFQLQMIQMTEQYEARQLNSLRAALDAQEREYIENKTKLAAIVPKDHAQEEEKSRRQNQLTNDYLRTKAQLEADVAKVSADATNRRAIAVANYQTEIKKVNDSQADYISKTEAMLTSEARLAQSKLALADASEEVRAQAEAEAKVMAGGQERLNELYKGYKQAAGVYEELVKGAVNVDNATDEQAAAIMAAYNVVLSYNTAIEQLNRLLPEWAKNAGEVAKATSLQTQFVNGAKNLASSLADAILEGGKDGGRKLKDWFKDTFVKQPIKIALQAFLQPVGNFAQSILMGGYSPAAGGAAGAVGAAGSGMNLISGVSSFLGLGANLGMGSFGAGLATGFNALGGGLGGIAGSLSAAGSIGGAGGLGMALGTLGPIAAGAALLYSLFGKKRGGPKHDGTFGGLGDMGVGNSANQDLLGMARDSVKSMTDSFKSLAATLGGNASGYKFGIGLSTDPEGTAPSMAQVRAYRDGTAFTESVDLNIGRSEEDLKNAVSNQVVEVLVRTLRDSGVKEEYLAYFDSISAGLDAQGKMEALAGIAQIVKLTETLVGLGPQFKFLADQSLAAKVALAEMSGGFDALTANLNAYYENFYSDAEKRVISARNIATALSKAGMAFSESDILSIADMANAKDVFRGFVEAYIAMGEGGNKQTAALLSVAGAFNSLIPEVKELEDTARSAADILEERKGLEEQLLSITNNTVELRRREREALDETNRALFDRVQMISDARDTLQRAYDQELSNIDKQIDKHKELASRYSDFAKSLERFKADITQSDLSPLTPEQKYTTARARLGELYERAKTGDTEAMGALTGAAQDFLEASRVYNASNAQYTADFNMVRDGIDAGVVLAKGAADYASQQVTLLEQQRDYIQSIVDPMLGIRANTDTLVQAVLRIANMQTDPGISAYIAGQYQSLVGRAPTEVEQVTWNARAVMGATPTDLAMGIAGSPDFRSRIVGMLNAGDLWGAYNLGKGTGLTMAQLNQAAGLGAGTIEQWANANGMPIFHGGVDYVPRTGFALLQRGERVTSASQRDRETDALLAELRELKELMREQIGAIYDSNDRNAQQIVHGTAEAGRRLGFERSNAASARELG